MTSSKYSHIFYRLFMMPFQKNIKKKLKILIYTEVWILSLATLSQMFSLNRKLILFISGKIFYQILPSQYV